VDRIADGAAKEARRDVLLEQLATNVQQLSGKLDDLYKEVQEVRSDLRLGASRMDRLENSLAHLKEDLEEHEEAHAEEMKENRSMWSKVVPNLLTSVASTIVTAALLGGIAYSLLSPRKESSSEYRSDYAPSSHSAPADRPSGGR